MLSRLARRFSITSPKFFLFLAGASAIFVYLLSPTRDALDKFSAPYEGSPLWLLRSMPEGHRMLSAFILVGLLAISMTSTKLCLLLTGASVIFVYLVSPMRDPAYQPMRGMSGSQLWWLKGMREDHWVLGAFILAGLLAINLTLNLWQWYFSQPYLTDEKHQAGILLRHFVNGMMYFAIGVVMWWVLYFVFLFYLLMQWLVD